MLNKKDKPVLPDNVAVEESTPIDGRNAPPFSDTPSDFIGKMEEEKALESELKEENTHEENPS